MEDRPSLTLGTQVQFIPGVGPKRAAAIASLGVRTAQDLLFFFPRGYEWPAPPAAVDDLENDQPASMIGVVSEAELVSRNAGKSVFGVLVTTATGPVRLLFFNQPFRADTLTLDRRLMFSGKPRLNGLRWEFVHPKVTLLSEEESAPTPRPIPVYPLREGLKQTDLRRVVATVLPLLPDDLPEVMPKSLRERIGLSLTEAGIEGFEKGSREGSPLTTPSLFADEERTLVSRDHDGSNDIERSDQTGSRPNRSTSEDPDAGGPNDNVVVSEIGTAVRQMHAPEHQLDQIRGQTRFVFQELLVMQLALALRRRQLTTDLAAPPIEIDARIDARIRKRLPFELTSDQDAAVGDIRADLRRQFPMNRLLQGDVGSGKTAVAVYAMLAAAACGHQSVMMAPTEVLARQHHRTLTTMLESSATRVGLLCGSLSAAERRDILARMADGSVDLVIGTQSLLYEVRFAKLGLCVIDEQHKFGVAQRVSLRGGGVDPHYLVMSATPIPRSMAMTVFGDVDLTSIRGRPPGRGEVHTYLVSDEKRPRWWDFVRKSIDEGRQAFVVAPRIQARGEDDVDGDSSADGEDISSVTGLHQELRSGPLAGFRVSLLHGRMPAEEKQSLMRDFAEGRIDVMVSTTVIEVGIDVPNATIMTIAGAERFGLAQLHQLRGRVGRGGFDGHCAVLTDRECHPEEIERLAIFEKTRDGFALAEADFRLRGPGDLLGRRQSGLPPMRIADLNRDVELISIARRMAQEMVDVDPHLEDTGLQPLKNQVMRRYQKRLELGDVA